MRVLFFATMLLVAYVAIDGGLGLPLINEGNGVSLQQGYPGKTIKDEPQSMQLNSTTTKRDGHFTHFFRRVFMGHLVEKLDGGKARKIHESGKTIKDKPQSMQLNSTTTKREGPFTHFFRRVLMGHPVEKLDGGKPRKIDESVPDSIKDDSPWEPVLRPRIKRSPPESWYHWFYGTVWPVIKGKNTIG
ncbi:unnamed protein product [Orchesella dallaii]|uniref:Uncharacterized protein n=1 Tax=Orchesella dallaii TaxID=48710 RepID=A0ABP1PXX5_9HEXA